MKTTTWKQLAQRYVRTTSDTLIYQPSSSTMWTIIKTIIVCNTTGSAATYSLWVNPNSSTSGDDWALMKNIPIAATGSDQRIYPGDAGIILRSNTASVIFKAGTANALTVTLYGVEIEET